MPSFFKWTINGWYVCKTFNIIYFDDKYLYFLKIGNVEWQTEWVYLDFPFIFHICTKLILKQLNSFPSYMEKRKPYQLKGILAVYNMFQVAACCYLIHGVSIIVKKTFNHNVY